MLNAKDEEIKNLNSLIEGTHNMRKTIVVVEEEIWMEPDLERQTLLLELIELKQEKANNKFNAISDDRDKPV